MRHDQVEISGAPACPCLVLRDDERRRRQRHQLPGKKERDEITGDEHEFDRTHQHVERGPEKSGPAAPVCGFPGIQD